MKTIIMTANNIASAPVPLFNSIHHAVFLKLTNSYLLPCVLQVKNIYLAKLLNEHLI